MFPCSQCSQYFYLLIQIFTPPPPRRVPIWRMAGEDTAFFFSPKKILYNLYFFLRTLGTLGTIAPLRQS